MFELELQSVSLCLPSPGRRSLTSNRLVVQAVSRSVGPIHHVSSQGSPQSVLPVASAASDALYDRPLSLLRPVQGQLMRHAPAKWAEDKTPSQFFPVLHTRLQIDRRQKKTPYNSPPPPPSQPAPSSPISDWGLGGVSPCSQRLTVCPAAMALMDHPAFWDLLFSSSCPDKTLAGGRVNFYDRVPNSTSTSTRMTLSRIFFLWGRGCRHSPTVNDQHLAQFRQPVTCSVPASTWCSVIEINPQSLTQAQSHVCLPELTSRTRIVDGTERISPTLCSH